MRSCTAISLLILCLIWLVPSSASAQTTRPEQDWQISVLAFGPGPEIYERYGHCAIRLRNDARGIDLCYDWGNFSFDDPNFIGRFVSGRLRYWMEGNNTRAVLDAYIQRADRSVTEQVLDLTPREIDRLIKLITAEDDEAHRYYAYDYFRDNCATRIRDAIDQITDGAVRRSLDVPSGHTYRWQNRRVSPVGSTNTLLCVLMDFVMGPRVDVPLTKWSDAFIPTVLADALDGVQLSDEAGQRPLVRKRIALSVTRTPANGEPIAPMRPAFWTLPLGVLGGAILFALTRYARVLFYLVATAWSLFCGLGGIGIALMWAMTGHWPVGWNENLLQFTPLSLVIAVSIWHRRIRPAARVIAMVVAGLSVAGALVTISHLTSQANAPAICLAVPLHLAIYLGLRSPGLKFRQAARSSDSTSSLLDTPQGIPT